jgi:hypothetical protein
VGVLIYKKLWQWLIFPVLYLMLVISHSLFFARFAVPLMPWIAIFAAVGIVETVRYFKWNQWIVGGLVVLCLLQPLAKDLRSNYLLKQEDTRVTHLRWFMTNVQETVLLTTGMFGIPFVYRDVAEPWSIPLDPRIILIDKLASADLTRLNTLSEYPIRYVSVSNFATFPGYLPDTYLERRQALMQYADVTHHYQIISPWKFDWEPRLADIEDTYSPLRYLWKRNSPGPVIEVFRKD